MGGGFKESDWFKESSYRNRDCDRQRGHRSYSNSRRSSDYRSEEFYSRNDDYDDRKSYRSQNDYRERERRSRSRSLERSSRSHDHDQSGSSRSHDRHEERTERSKEKREIPPNNTLMVRNLPAHITDKDITAEINKFNFYPKEVRLMKNRETGLHKGFAFIEFLTIDQATKLKELTKDYITIGGEPCSLLYSFPKEPYGGDKNGIKNDWSCGKCGINNFKRRDECFKCGSHRDESSHDGLPPVVQQPTNVLVLRNLSSLTTEQRVLTIIGTLTALPIKSIRLLPDPSNFQQTNMCYLEVHSVYEATQLYSLLSSMADDFMIDDCVVNLSYGQRFEAGQVANSLGLTQNAALAALAAAQWKNHDGTTNQGKKSKKSLGTVNIDGVDHAKYEAPNYSTFQYDANSGYYYDSSTGFYYDSNSQYFYNSQTQKYMYYEAANQIYITVDSSGKATNETASTPAKKPTEEKFDKAKTAKKIAKDMERWAKTMNQKKEAVKPHLQTLDYSPEASENSSNTADAAFFLLEKQVTSEPVVDQDTSTMADPFEIVKNEEERLVDRTRLACLLCKRQFNSIELLTKHQQFSGLHKNNLIMLRQTLLNEEQLEHVEKVERELGYRDRAKERRDKFGIDDTREYPGIKFEKSTVEPAESLPPAPISDDNIGSRMLKAMGWTEGTGLGKSNQGMSSIIEVEHRKSGLGLGNKNVSVTNFTKESYKEAVKRTALQRFNEMSD